MYFLGIDCGTQGTKSVIFDSDTGRILAKGYAKHEIIAAGDGIREQKAQWWTDALKQSVRLAIHSGNIDGRKIAAVAVSGQQHGLVLLNKDGNVIRNVKLWNDTSTASFNAQIITDAGSEEAVWQEIGTSFPVGFTASKIRYVYAKEPEIWARVAHVLLPHDYINYYLTGEFGTDSSEASGTGYYDVIHKHYSKKMMRLIDPSGSLERYVPPVISWKIPLGKIRPAVAAELGISAEALVAVGGGDNTMGAIGTSAIIPGRCTMSLGTSGTVCLTAPSIQSRLDRLIQVYDVQDSWLATTCTLNATSATNIIQELFGISVNELDRQIATAEPGSQGVTVLPYFNGERMPPLPYAKGSIKHLTMQNCRSENLIRATAESVIYTLKWGYDKLVRSFPPPDNLIITGGGGNSAPWRQIVADVFAMPVLVMESDEGGAFGAALQAMSIVVRGEPLSGLCKRYIRFDKTKETLPEPAATEKYKQFFPDYKQFVSAEYSIVM